MTPPKNEFESEWLVQRPRQNPAFEARGTFNEEVQRVWEMCDGLTAVFELLETPVVSELRTRSILTSLRECGALLLPGETPKDVEDLVANWDESWSQTASGRFAVATRAKATTPREASRRSLAPGAMHLDPLSPEENAAVAEQVDLSPAEKRRAIAMRRLVETGTADEILGVESGASKAELRAAFLERSKEFHPDRHFGRELGTFEKWLAQIFDRINDAHKEIIGSVSTSSPDPQGFQTQAEHAAELYEQACQLEVEKDYAAALRLFKAAVNTDPRNKYLRRATHCALRARDLEVAESLAARAVDLRPNDPSTLRLLAQVFVAQNRLRRARGVLERAIALATSNDSLHRELVRELGAVLRRLER